MTSQETFDFLSGYYAEAMRKACVEEMGEALWHKSR